LANKSVAERSP